MIRLTGLETVKSGEAVEHRFLSSPNMPAYHAATQVTPLKFRTNSVPSSGKVFKTENVNQELLVELEDATLEEESFIASKTHYILRQCNSVEKLLVQAKGSLLKITSLTLVNESLYRNNCWEPQIIPHFLRSSTGASQPRRGHKVSRRVTIRRRIPKTSQEKIVEGTFLPTAGDEESGVAKWLNTVTRALLTLRSTWTSTSGRVTRSSSVPPRSWFSETSRKPLADGPMSLKPDLILRGTSGSPVFGPQPEFSWKGVVSFMELTSLSYSRSSDVRTVRNSIMRKAYAIFSSQPGRRFIFALSIANQEFRVHMFDRSGVVHSRPYDIHRSPCPLLCMLTMLAFGDPQDIGYDPTLTFSPPIPRVLIAAKKLKKPNLGTIKVDSLIYTIVRRIFFSCLIHGRGTSCWHVRYLGKDYVIKDSWVHDSRATREESILRLIQGVIGVPELVLAWTVNIEGTDDKTDARRFPLSYSSEVRIHRRLLMKPVAIPISEFESARELLSVFIDILDGTSEQ